jgi:restriction system protein
MAVVQRPLFFREWFMMIHAVVGLGILAIIIILVVCSLQEKAKRERRLRALELADIDNMGGLDFEHYLCRLLVHRGYQAEVTRASGDLGVDIVARRDGQKHAVQAKRYSKGVSRRAISDAVAGM